MWLAYAAGIAQGANNEAAAASLTGILSRLTPIEDASGDYDDPMSERELSVTEIADYRDQADLSEEAEVQAFYENAGIPPAPSNPQGNFGAGPPGANVR